MNKLDDLILRFVNDMNDIRDEWSKGEIGGSHNLDALNLGKVSGSQQYAFAIRGIND